MGKPSSASKRAKKLAKKKGLKVSGNKVIEDEDATGGSSDYSIDDVLDKASSLMDEYNYELAQKFCQRALEIDADNVRALEVTANLLLESGQVESAKHCLGRSITVAPDTGYSKYLSLAQLMDGEEALSLYNKGIELILKEQQTDMPKKEDEPQDDTARSKADKLRKELSNSYCAVAELFMTDLCDADEAESECSGCVQKAVEADESNPEAWQTKARLHLVKSEFEESKSSISQSLSLWLPKYTAVLEDLEVAADPVEVCPLPYTTRLSTVKILMELEMWDEATQVLNGLTAEDESVVDVWYLLGLTNKLRADFEAGEATDEEGKSVAEGYNGNARYYLKKALRVQAKNPSKDKQMVAHVKELLDEVGKGDGEDDKSDEEDWENVEGSTDEEEEDGEEIMEQDEPAT